MADQKKPEGGSCTTATGALDMINGKGEGYGNQWWNTLTFGMKMSVVGSIGKTIWSGDVPEFVKKRKKGMAVGTEVPDSLHLNRGQLTGDWLEDWVGLADIGNQKPVVLNFGSCS